MPLNDSTDSTAYGYADSGQAFGMMTDTGGAKPENEAVNASFLCWRSSPLADGGSDSGREGARRAMKPTPTLLGQ